MPELTTEKTAEKTEIEEIKTTKPENFLLVKKMLRVFREEPEKVLEIVKLAQPRMKTLDDFIRVADFFFYPIKVYSIIE